MENVRRVDDHSAPAAGSVVVVVMELVFWWTLTKTGLTRLAYNFEAPYEQCEQ